MSEQHEAAVAAASALPLDRLGQSGGNLMQALHLMGPIGASALDSVRSDLTKAAAGVRRSAEVQLSARRRPATTGDGEAGLDSGAAEDRATSELYDNAICEGLKGVAAAAVPDDRIERTSEQVQADGSEQGPSEAKTGHLREMLNSLLRPKRGDAMVGPVPVGAIIRFVLGAGQGGRLSRPERRAVLALLGARSQEVLLLCREWVSSVGPHVLSKIDRVTYGLLRDSEMPKSSDAMAGGLLQGA